VIEAKKKVVGTALHAWSAALLCGAGMTAVHAAPAARHTPVTQAAPAPAVPSAANAVAEGPAPVLYPAFVAPTPAAPVAPVASVNVAAAPVAAAAASSGASRFLDVRNLLQPVSTVASEGTTLLTHVRDGAGDLVTSAMNFLGVPYRRGGNTADTGFDCSGFTRHVFETSVGLLLPRRADEQAKEPSLLKVGLQDLKPGDLVFFNTMRRTFSHVGIYLGEGKFIHSPKPGASVRVEDLNVSYWARRFTGGRRAPGLENATAAGASPAPVAAPAISLSGPAVPAPAFGALPARLAPPAGTMPTLGER
jgi:cell wall-associated NlpC family hydrolase